MKKSSRLIGGAVLALLLLVLMVNTLLYYRLREGKVSSMQQLKASGRAVFKTGTLHHLTLSGTLWVNVIPSDSDYIVLPREEAGMRVSEVGVFGRTETTVAGKTPLFRVEGDTLFVNGGNEAALHRPYADWYYRQGLGQISVYVSSLEHVLVVNGQVLLKGAARLDSGRCMSVDAVGSTVWLAEMDGRPEAKSMQKPFPSEFFDSVSLHLVNSVLLLNKPAKVGALYARLDSSSELNDRGAALARPAKVNSSIESRVSFTGENLKDMNVVIH
ncbi:MAG TPA: hypothetical protein VI233_01985 [Puia sp.]